MKHQMNKPDNDVNKLVDEVVCGSDRKFFQQHLHRRFRIRPAWDVEMEQIEQTFNATHTAACGFCWWVAVKKIKPGVRMRAFFQAPLEAPVGIPEDIAKRVWLACERNKKGLAKVNRLMREA